MIFLDRQQAGKALAEKLISFQGKKNTLVLGLPRGGVVIAFEIALSLGLPLDVIVTRKIGAPHNEELAIGAVDEMGNAVYNESMIQMLKVPQQKIEAGKKKAEAEAKHRFEVYRQKKYPQNFKTLTVILADDGLATGATMKTAVASAKLKGAKKIIIAVPVGSSNTVALLQKEVNELICLHTSTDFGSVGAFYENFDPISEKEVLQLLAKIPSI